MFTLSLYILFSDAGYEFSKVTLNVKEKFSVWKIWEELSLLIGCLILKLKVWTGYQDPLLHLHKGSQTNKQMKRTIANIFRVLRKWCSVILRIRGPVPCPSPAVSLELPLHLDFQIRFRFSAHTSVLHYHSDAALSFETSNRNSVLSGITLVPLFTFCVSPEGKLLKDVAFPLLSAASLAPARVPSTEVAGNTHCTRGLRRLHCPPRDLQAYHSVTRRTVLLAFLHRRCG